MTTPKSPEQVVKEYEILLDKLYERKPPQAPDSAWLRSSMASLLCYMAERMPEHTSSSLPLPPYKDNLKYKEIDGKSCITEVDGAYNAAIDDCRCILVQMADGIWKE